MGVNFQIGQCRIYVDVDATKKYYGTLPRISENCTCDDCAYFESNVTNQDIRIFKILRDMGVDLTRQPNINPDGVCSIGETEKYKRSYMGYYQFFGQLNKTQKKTQTRDVEGDVETVDFYETTDDTNIQYKIKTDISDKLTVDFYLECEKING
jgi:hypothetical protein